MFTDKIDDVYIKQYHENGKVELEIEVSTKHNTDSDIYITVDEKRVKAENGRANFVIENPKLWWVRGFGEQPLYEVKTELVNNGKTVDENITKIGLRTLTISLVNGREKNEFCFVINGVKIISGFSFNFSANIFIIGSSA